MPVAAGMYGGKGQFKRFERYSCLDMPVLRDVRAVVIVDEPVTDRAAEDGRGEQQQDQDEHQVPVSCPILHHPS